jgi:hypothetical protein
LRRRFASELAHRPNPTCGMACRVAREKRQAFERNARPCVMCGKLFYAAPGSFEKEGRKSCSLKCRAAWQRQNPHASAEERFWRRVTKGDGCWIRAAAKLQGGHIAFKDRGRAINSSRYAWILATGEALERSEFICHCCDVPACVRNDDIGTYEVDGVTYPRRGHLFKANAGANNADRENKGRGRPGRAPMPGVQNGRAKLTEDDVRAIRAAADAGVDLLVLATRYHVTRTSIDFIFKRKTWRHLE